MICSLCGRTGIRWMWNCGNLTHTECPHCGGRNCQIPPPPDDEDELDIVDGDYHQYVWGADE